MFAGDLEGDILGIDGVHFSIVKIDLQVHNPETGQYALRGGGVDAFFH